MSDGVQFLRQIKTTTLSHFYLFVVEEEYEYANVIEQIEKKLFPEGFDDFSLERHDGSGLNLIEILEIAGTIPMMTDMKMIIITNADSIKDIGVDRFEKYLDDPCDTSICILKAAKSPSKTKWYKALQKRKLVVNFMHQKESNLLGWIMSYVKRMGYRIAPDAVKLIINQLGNNQDEITRQLSKITLLMHKDEMITAETVRDVILRSRRRKYWELSNAAGERNLKLSLLIINQMIEDGEPAPLLLGILSNYFKRILTGRILYDRGAGMNDICEAVGQKWYREKFYRQVQRFPMRRVENIFSALRAGDENIKSGFMTQADNLQRILFVICSDSQSIPSASSM